jgi:uncharacterized protein (DUF433 family)
MNNKGNIFEELNKMKGLIHAKAGVVISEQGDPLQIIKRELNDKGALVDSNEELIVNTIINNYKTKEQFEDFLYRYNQATGKDFAEKIGGTINPDQDQKEWNSLINHLAKMGINLNYDYMWGKTSMSGATPKALPTAASSSSQAGLTSYMNTVGAATPRQKNINFNYCSVKNGKIENAKLAFNGKTFDEYVSTFTLTPEEIAAAKATCPNVVVPNVSITDNTQKGGTNTVNTRFVKSATDLGLQSGKMDLQTLQSILAKLQDDGSQSTITQDTSTTTQQTPDLTQLTSLLNQLNA